MGSPIDRTAKTALDSNLVNGVTSDAPKVKANNDVLYNYADTLNAAQDAHAASATLPHADSSVTGPKIRDAAVTTAKIADLAVTQAKIANGAVGVNQLATGLAVTADVNAQFAKRGIDVTSAPYNAVGDGVTDNYAALKAVATAINAVGGGTVIFPPGTYYINQYRITGGPSQNSVENILFQNCNGVSIIGYNAVISVKGDFYRPDTNYSQVNPFEFRDCTNASIDGFELDGNVDLSTRAGGVTEGNSYGIALYSCDNVMIMNMRIHHFQTDGVYVADTNVGTASKNVTMINVKSYNNARQGMSLVQVRGFTAIGCEFNDTGRTGGTYGAHAPQAGVDIEPNRIPPNVDILTGDIKFIGCKFKNNVGSQLVAAYADKVENVSCDNCDFISATDSSTLFVIMAINGGVIENSRFDCDDNEIYPVWSYAAGEPYQRTILRYNIIRGNGRLIQVANTGGQKGVIIEHNEFIGTHISPYSSFFPYVQNPYTVFRYNNVFIPKEAYVTGQSGLHDTKSLLQNVRVSEENRFTTDLVPATTQHFDISYSGAVRITNDHFDSGTAVRNEPSSGWNNSFPYSRGMSGGGDQQIITRYQTNDFNIITLQTAAPTTGTWRRGDIVWNASPSASGKVGWVCVTAGTPGTWKPFGAIDA